MNWDCQATTLFLAEDRISELDAMRRLALLEHVEVCAECAARIAEERAIDRLLDAFFSDAPAAAAPSGLLDELPSVACCFVDAPERSPFAAIAARSAAAPWHKKLAWAACAVIALAVAAWGVSRVAGVFVAGPPAAAPMIVNVPDGATVNLFSGTTTVAAANAPGAAANPQAGRLEEMKELIKAGKASVTISNIPGGNKLYLYNVVLPGGQVMNFGTARPLVSPVNDEQRNRELADLVSSGKVEFVNLAETGPGAKIYNYRFAYSDGVTGTLSSDVPLTTAAEVQPPASK
jgi:hypothetical protein